MMLFQPTHELFWYEKKGMPIITIYQSSFTAGEEIANRVARSLGYRCVSREALIEVSKLRHI